MLVCPKCTVLAAECVLESVCESGSLVLVVHWTTPGVQTRADHGPSLAAKTLDEGVISTVNPTRLDHCGSRRRHGKPVTFLEHTLQQCGNVMLDRPESNFRCHVSAGESAQVLVQSFLNHRLRRAWKCAGNPGEGQFAFYRESAIKPPKKLSWEVGARGESTTTLLKSCSANLPANLLQSFGCVEPSIPGCRLRQPTPYFPGTSTCSKTTRDKPTPDSVPKLSELLTSPTTRDSSRRPHTSNPASRDGGASALRRRALNRHIRERG